jgi:16S rRNA processing protein RimM
LTITGVRYHKGMALLTFAEVGDMAAAQRLRGCFLQVPAADLPPLPEGRYYIYQLVGLSVWEKDVCLGALTEVLQPGSNDVYIVREGSREILVPALKSVIKGVDLAARRMDVELPAGLLELYGG